MILSFRICCEPDLVLLTSWGALPLIFVLLLLCSAKTAVLHWYGLTATCRAVCQTTLCTSCFGRCWLDSGLTSHGFVFISLLLLPSTVSPHCLKQMKWERAVFSSAASACTPGKASSCVCDPAAWLQPYSSSGYVVASEAAEAPRAHLCSWSPKEAFCLGKKWQSRASQEGGIVLFCVFWKGKGTP